MRSVPVAISTEAPVSEVVTRLSGTDLDALPVVDAAGRYRGVISTRQLERALADSPRDATAGDLAEQPPTTSLDQSLAGALPLLLHGETSGLPVLAPDETTVVGWLTHRDVLRAYQSRRGSSGPDEPRWAETRHPAAVRRPRSA
jgi:CIC family chloride channel protein